MTKGNMSRTGLTRGQRTTAVYLLVLCLATAALLHFASQTFPHTAAAAGQAPGVSAPDGEIALVLGTKSESPVSAELQAAVFRSIDCLWLFDGDGGLLPGTPHAAYPTLGAPTTEIRGPPPTSQS